MPAHEGYPIQAFYYTNVPASMLFRGNPCYPKWCDQFVQWCNFLGARGLRLVSLICSNEFFGMNLFE